MGRFDTLDKRISIIRKVVEDENDLNLELDAKQLVSIFDNTAEICIDSKTLKLGDNKNIVFYEQQDGYDEEKMIANLTKTIDFCEYKEFEIVVFVHSIEEKYKVIDTVKPQIEEFIRKNKKSKKILEFTTNFVPRSEMQVASLKIDSAIRIIEYEHKTPKAIGQVYNANLFDLVELYNIMGDSLFRDNVRKKIENVLEVDTQILETLEKEPENFWFFNNGVTLMICENCILQRREYQLDINVAEDTEISIINGAQTISVAAQYYYRLKNELEKNKADESLSQQMEKINDTKVLLRIIKKDKMEEVNEFYKDISISLNRQKAINEADIRYTDYLVDDINTISEHHRAPYFVLDKREDKSIKKKGRHYSLESFVKIAAIYLLQEPGSARAAKGKYIKQDTQWNRLKISEEGEITQELFLRRYKPFIITERLFVSLSEKLAYMSKKLTNIVMQNICSYSAEFLVAYIIWVANGNNNSDFTNFPDKCNYAHAKWDVIVSEYIRIVYDYLKSEKKMLDEEIDSNLFKKDTVYKELREYMDAKYLPFQGVVLELFSNNTD